MSKQGKRNTALFAAAVLLCLTLFTTYLVGGLYARYTTVTESRDGARVARYVFDVKGGTAEQAFTIDLKEIQKPGDEDSCTFTVTNADENGVCEVTQKYSVYIKELGSLPLTYKIGEAEAPANAGGSETLLLSDTLTAGTKETDTITLNVSWPSENAKLTYAGGAASLQIRILAEQID